MKLLKIEQVVDKTTLSRPTIWRKEKAGEFPVRRQISTNRVGWIEEEIDKWCAERANGIVAPKVQGQKKKQGKRGR